MIRGPAAMQAMENAAWSIISFMRVKEMIAKDQKYITMDNLFSSSKYRKKSVRNACVHVKF